MQVHIMFNFHDLFIRKIFSNRPKIKDESKGTRQETEKIVESEKQWKKYLRSIYVCWNTEAISNFVDIFGIRETLWIRIRQRTLWDGSVSAMSAWTQYLIGSAMFFVWEWRGDNKAYLSVPISTHNKKKETDMKET